MTRVLLVISVGLLFCFSNCVFPSPAFSASQKQKKFRPQKDQAAEERRRKEEEKRLQEAEEQQKEVEERREEEEEKQLKAAQEQREAEENRQKEAEETKRLTELFLRNQSVFIRKGEVMVELNTFYNRNARTDFVQVEGGAIVVQNTRRFFDNTIFVRYGLLTDGLELDLIVPAFVYAEQDTNFGVGQTSRTEDGIGDVIAALRYEVWYERGNRPGLVLDILGKSTTGGDGLTGTGTWAMGGGVTLLKSIDPVVFFGRVGYVHNFASESRELGDIFEYRLGMGFSLNDRVSFNMQFAGSHIGASQTTEIAPVGGVIGPLVFSTQPIEIMNLLFTTTVIVTKKFSVEPIFGLGLTNQSFTIVGLRLPYRF